MSLAPGIVAAAISTGVSYPPSAQGLPTYELYWDGATVRMWPSGEAFLTAASPSARFFSINFFAAGAFQGTSINLASIAQVGTFNKSDELAHVLGAITQLTHVRDVVVIAHSLGGLVARGYIEDLAIPDSTGPPTVFAHDMAKLITVDTPHGGVAEDNILNNLSLSEYILPSGTLGCILESSQDKSDLETASPVVAAINDPTNMARASLNLPIAAIRNYTLPGAIFGSDGDDGIVTRDEQSIATIPSALSSYKDFDHQATTPLIPSCLLLHLLSCLGQGANATANVQLIGSQLTTSDLAGLATTITVKATSGGTPVNQPFSFALVASKSPSLDLGNSFVLEPATSSVSLPYTFVDGAPTYYNVAPGYYYTFQYFGGGPSGTPIVEEGETQFLGVDPITRKNNWSLTFTVDFPGSSPGSSPTVTTLSATGVEGGDATLNATVNPNGGFASVSFEWGTDSALASYTATQVMSVGSGSNATAVSHALSNAIDGIRPGTTYYYRAVGVGTQGGLVLGNIVSFTMLATLPAPTQLAPQNHGISIVAPPTFSWNAVANATAYRVIAATNASALPTDPTSGACGSGCVWNNQQPTINDTPPSGIFAPATTYYWEVHAGSATQFGAWSGVFSFTTEGVIPTDDFSLQAAPMAASTPVGGSATYVINSSTRSGNPQSILMSYSSAPLGTTLTFSPTSFTSGSASTLTVNAGSAAAPGVYTIISSRDRQLGRHTRSTTVCRYP